MNGAKLIIATSCGCGEKVCYREDGRLNDWKNPNQWRPRARK